MDYLKLFQNHSEYEAFVSGGTMMKPNVSHCINENEVHYNQKTWADEYLTFEVVESGTITIQDANGYSPKTISYSVDGGNIWTELTTNRSSQQLGGTLSAGDKVMVKGNNQEYGENQFGGTAIFNVYGNIMSLINGDNFAGTTTLESSNTFSGLFGDTNITSAENLILPATALTENCYYGMFSNCTSLTVAPELPATTLANGCYGYMFGGCTSLTVTPELPALTLASECYQTMFSNCTSLTVAPELPATTLANGCYDSMFASCTSLTVAPELPATTLVTWCYGHMFANCSGLTVPPELPALTLASQCYIDMFWNCTSLTTAPVLSATTLVEECYKFMFEGCTSLNSITCLATDKSAVSCTYAWMRGVAASGTFTKAASMTGWPTGESGIPEGWTVQDA